MDTSSRAILLLSYLWLQWSHDLSAMDTIGEGLDTEKPNELQWSHDLSAMDTGYPFLAEHPSTSRFNGAMTFQPWIPDDSEGRWRVAPGASMEP